MLILNLTVSNVSYVYIKVNKFQIVRLTSIWRITRVIMHAECVYSIPKISLRRVASNMNEQRSRSDLCE